MIDPQDVTFILETAEKIFKPHIDEIKNITNELKESSHDPKDCPNTKKVEGLEAWQKDCKLVRQNTSSKAWDITKIIITAVVGIIAIWLMVVIGLK